MERAQTRLLVVLSALVLGVGGALYFQGPEEEAVDPEATSPVWTVAAENLLGVRIERETGTLRLEKVEDTWFVREPFDARADDDQVRELTNTLGEVALGIPIGGTAEPAEFGLGTPPNARVGVTLADGTERSLDVGIAAPVGFRTYVRAADGQVVAVNGDVNRPVQADAARYRDRKIFRLDPAQVREVTVASPEGTLRVHGQGRDWWVDGYTHADADKVDDLVVGLGDLRFDVVRDGLTVEPTIEVDVRLADGQVLGLDVGPPGESEVLAVTSDGRSGTLWPDAIAQLGRGPSDVGWRTAFGIRMDEADHIEFGPVAGPTVGARRDGAAWTAEGRDTGAVYDGIMALSGVPIEYRRDPPPSPSPVEYTVAVTEGARGWTIEVGPDLGDGFRAARDPAGGQPYRVPTADFDAAVGTLREPAP